LNFSSKHRLISFWACSVFSSNIETFNTLRCINRKKKISASKRLMFRGSVSTVNDYVRFAKLPLREREVGARVRAARMAFRVSRGGLASLLVSTEDQLTNVELGRSALRFTTGWNLCYEFDLNPLWLAEGRQPVRGFHEISTEAMEDDDLFSEAIAGLSQRIREEGTQVNTPVNEWMSSIGIADTTEFWRRIDENAKVLSRLVKSKVKRQLTLNPRRTILGAMTLHKASLWPRLRKRLTRILARRGMKAALARDVGVTRQAVDAWLSKSRRSPAAPSAEMTLRVLEWVRVAEQQRKKRRSRKRGVAAAAKPQKRTDSV